MGIVDKEGKFPGMRAAFCSDSLSIVFGSIFGLAPLTAFIESGAGVEAGARTGLAAVFIAFYFFISVFFAPIVSNIPPWATGGALIIVGSLMARSLGRIQWHNTVHAITAFITVIIMPLTYSIAYGVIAGIGAFCVMEGTIQFLALLGVPKPVFEKPFIDETAPLEPIAKSIEEDEDSDEVDMVEKPKEDDAEDEEAP
jgi:AGZA family xanthine/uracil permease-like MFS transporter